MPLAPGSCAQADTIRTLPSYRRGTATTRSHCVGRRLMGKDHPSARDSIFPALIWKIHLLHGAQTRLVQNAAITGDAPGTLSRLGTERIQGQCAALLKITQEIPVSLQACHGR